MTVTVTLPDGGIEKYMRYADAYIKHSDGTLDVVRVGAKAPHTYASGEWSGVEGAAKQWRLRHFWG
jgi:hypothetical protein